MFGLFRRKKEAAAEPPIQVVPAHERRIYVIDFDRTITILHTGSVAYGNEIMPDFIQSNVKKGFVDFVRKVTARGHKVYIASYNDDAGADQVEDEALAGHDLIKFYMDQVFGQDQDIFTMPQRNGTGEIVASGTIIAGNTQDLKQHHLDIITRAEGLDPDNPDDMKRIYLLDDDEDVVRYFMDKGCTTLVPFSASRSADTAVTKTLFTAYMPPSFVS